MEKGLQIFPFWCPFKKEWHKSKEIMSNSLFFVNFVLLSWEMHKSFILALRSVFKGTRCSETLISSLFAESYRFQEALYSLLLIAL